jgi:hypothetical protein
MRGMLSLSLLPIVRRRVCMPWVVAVYVVVLLGEEPVGDWAATALCAASARRVRADEVVGHVA